MTKSPFFKFGAKVGNFVHKVYIYFKNPYPQTLLQTTQLRIFPYVL